MKITTLVTSLTATTNAAISYQFINRQRLDAIYYSIFLLATAGGPSNVVYEFSLQSSGQQTTNDPVGVVATIRAGTTAISVASITDGLITPIGFQFQPVDRLYVNLLAGTAASAAGAHFTLLQN